MQAPLEPPEPESALANPDQPEPSEPLAGPPVDERRSRTLIAAGMSRGFAPLQNRPEIAVIELLDLDAPTAQAARELAEQRNADLAALLVDRIDTLRAITDATTAGDTAEARRLMHQLWTAHDPTHAATPLLGDLLAVLPEPAAEEAARLVHEYLDAWAEGERQPGEPEPAVRERLAFRLFQAELRTAYDVSLDSTRRAMQAIYDAVDPTPTQRDAIRSIVIDHIKTHRLSATPAARRATMRRIYDALDPDRRAKMFDYAMRIVLPE